VLCISVKYVNMNIDSHVVVCSYYMKLFQTVKFSTTQIFSNLIFSSQCESHILLSTMIFTRTDNLRDDYIFLTSSECKLCKMYVGICLVKLLKLGGL
jgi:hypothetical protein